MSGEGANGPRGARPASCPDPEAIAAFLDGGLEPAERAAFEKHLGECEACYEVLSESLRFEVEGRGEAAEGGEVVVHPAARRWILYGAAAAAAGLVALVVGTPLLDTLTGRGLGPELPVHALIRPLVAGGPGATPAPFDGAGWSRARSAEGFTAGLGPEQRSFRAGVRAVDLELALAAGDAQRAREALRELADLVASFELSEAVAAAYGEIGEQLEAGEPPESLSPASRRIDPWLAEAADGGWYRFGKWAEAGRAAAAAGSVDFFRRRAVRRFPQQARELDPGPKVADALAWIEEALARGPEAAEFDTLAGVLTGLVREAGNR